MASGRLTRMLPLLVAIAVVGAACDGGGTSGTGGGGQEGPFRIAFLSQGPINAWGAQYDAMAEKWAKESPDISEFIYFNGDGNAEKQVTQMENAASANPDGIVVLALGAATLVGPVERAMDQGIPVIFCEDAADTDKYVSLVARDWKAIGLEQADLLAQQMGEKGDVIGIDGAAGATLSEELKAGFVEGLGKYPNITIVKEGYGDWSVSKSKSMAEAWIASGVQVDGAFGGGGEAVNGMIQAFNDAGLPVPPIAGSTAENGALRLLKEAGVHFVAWQIPPLEGVACLDTMVKYLKGEKVEKFTNLDNLYPEPVRITLEGFTWEQVDKYYNPEYTDDYIYGTDKYLNDQELCDLNLKKSC